MVGQNDAIIELPTVEATRLMDPSSPASQSRWPNTKEVYLAKAKLNRSRRPKLCAGYASRLVSQARGPQRVLGGTIMWR